MQATLEVWFLSHTRMLLWLVSCLCNGQAVAIGPRVVPAVPEVNWGRIDCLKDFTQPLVLTNKSSIPAQFKTFIKSPRSKFRMDILEGTLQPEEVVRLPF